MKTMKKLLTVLMVLLLCTTAFTVPAFAATTTQDGLEVTLSTDKNAYAKSEAIITELTVKNTGSTAVTDLSLETLIPAGYALTQNSASTMQVSALEAGESVTLKLTMMSEDVLNSNPGTDDIPVFWLIVAMAVLIVLVAALVSMKHQTRDRVMSFLLCAALLMAMVPAAVVSATDNTGLNTITISENFTADGETVTLNALVRYQAKMDPQLQPVVALTLTYDEQSGLYIADGTETTLSGTVTNGAAITDAYFQVQYNGFVLATYDFIPSESWSVENFGAIPGDNTLNFFLTDTNGYVWEQSIGLVCTSEDSLSQIIEDPTADADADGLPDYIETLFGTDPNVSDTDGDGLPDDAEAQILGCDAREADHDGDGVSDSDEDVDQDGLTNAQEIAAGTKPCVWDSDGDTLSDSDEINTYGTDPMNKDTDYDGLHDDWEIANGTDPLTAQDTVTVTEALPMGESTAEIIMDLPGHQAQSFVMQGSDVAILQGNIVGQLSAPVSLTVDGNLPESGATLRFRLPDTYPSEATADFIPVVYYFNPETELLEEVPTTYHDHVAETHLEHFSNYILLNKREFDEVWETEIRIPGDTTQDHPDRLDVVLVIDSSGSMDWNDSRNLRLEAAKQFVAKLGEKDRAAVIDFDYYTNVLCQFTNDKAALNSAISRIDDYGGTSLTAGISPAINMFTSASYDNDAYRYIIMLTDGDGDYNTSLTAKAKENNIQIFTIGLGSEVVTSRLQAIADGTGGKYYFASTADKLVEIYDETAKDTIDYTTDTNKDGISDYYTRLIAEGKLRDGAGNRYFAGAISNAILNQFPFSIDVSELIYQSIQHTDDFDGDGIKNGDELKVTHKGDKVYVKMISNPVYKNSDCDPFNDYQESILGGHPMDYDVDIHDLTNRLCEDGIFTAALSAKDFVDSGWYRFTLGLGNYVYGGEYDWVYAAEKQLLSCSESYAENLINAYEALYLSENYLTITNNVLSELNDLLSVYDTITTPVADVNALRDLTRYTSELNEARNALAKMDLSDMSKIVAQIEKIDGLYSNAAKSADSLSAVNFGQFKSLNKICLKVPSWVTKAGDVAGKVGDVLTYITAAIDNIDAVCSTISGYSALAASDQAYGAMDDLLENLMLFSDITFVSAAAADLRLSLANEYYAMVSETRMVLLDTAYSWDEVIIDLVLAECGPVGWAIAAGRTLGNFITGIGNTCKQHLYMITAGEAGIESGEMLMYSLYDPCDPFSKAGPNTLDYMLLCGTMRITGEEQTKESSAAQSWLYEKIFDHKGVVSSCNDTIDRVTDILLKYGMEVDPAAESVGSGVGGGGHGGGGGGGGHGGGR